MLPLLATAIRLMTFNVNYAMAEKTEPSLDAIAHADADVVLLQEITLDWQHAIEARLGKQYPHMIFRLHERGPGGLAVLSKHEITAETLVPGPSWFPAQRVVIDGVQILNVHLRPAVDGGSWVKGFFTT